MKFRAQIALLAAVTCTWALILCAEPAPHQCDDPLIRVTIADPDAAENVCAIAASADERFAALGLRHNREISIVVTEDLDVARTLRRALQHRYWNPPGPARRLPR